MASIGLKVQDGRFNIELDRFEWKSLSVDGDSVPAQDPGRPDNLLFVYNQEDAGSLSFVAKSDNNINIVNPADVMTITSPTGEDKSYTAVVNYTTDSDGIRVEGWLFPLEGKVNGASDQGVPFSQGSMTGVFAGIQ